MKQVISYCLLFVFGNLNLYLSLIFAQSLPQVTPTVTMITPTPTVKATPVSTPRVPTVVTDGASLYDDGTVILESTVNSHGFLTTIWVEYGTTSGYYINKSSTETVSGTSDTRVSINIGKILENVIYYYRITTQNSEGTSYGDERYFGLVSETPPSLSPTQSFTLSPTLTSTTPVPTPRVPTVVTGDASYDDETVVLGGTVNAYGLLTTAWFEYGTTTGYYTNKSSTEAVSGTSDTHVSISIGKILGEVIYYYRIAAQNSAGISYGDERYFSLVSETPLPSSPTPSLALSLTPTSECKAKKIKVSSGVLRLMRGQSATVVISLEGEDCVPAGQTVIATTNKVGSKRISISSSTMVADENGNATFTITAKNKIGNAIVRVKMDNLKKTIIVKIRK